MTHKDEIAEQMAAGQPKKADDGGPAFPHPSLWGVSAGGGKYQVGELMKGMSLRDWFASHAPAHPQSWFVPTMPSERPRPKWTADEDTERAGKVYEAVWQAEKECGDCFHDANAVAAREWDEEREKQRQIQWPYAWADVMLAERSK